MHHKPHSLSLRVGAIAALLTLAGCEFTIPGVYPDPRVVARESEAKAIGGACRHALRGLEDCYTLNPKASKSLVFAGWKDMDLYMRDNKIEGTPSVISRVEEKPARSVRSSRDQDSRDPQRGGDDRS